MIWAHSEIGKPAIPVPTAGNAIERSPRSAAMRSACAVELRRHAGRVDHKAGAQFAAGRDGRAANGNAADGVAFPLDRVAALPTDRPGNAATKLQVIVRGIDDGVDVHFRQVALKEHDFLAEAHKLGSFQTGALFRDAFKRFLIIAENNVGPAQHNGPSDQIGFGRHQFQSLVARRRIQSHFPRAVEFVARVQKHAMVAFADQLVEFLNRHPVLPEIAQVQFHFPFFEESLCLSAGGARRLLQKLDFCFHDDSLSLKAKIRRRSEGVFANFQVGDPGAS
jgi:hypothetical protein